MARKRRGRGEGSVYRRADGLWVGSVSLGFTPSGKRRRKPVYGATKAEAQTKLRAMQHAADVGALPDGGNLTVSAWLTHWLSVTAAHVEPGTHGPYSRHVEKYIRPRIGRLRLTRLRRTDVQALYAGLLADGVSGEMVRKAGTTLVTSLNAAVQAGELAANPATGVRKPRKPRAKVEVMTPDQAAAFAAACRADRLGPLFHLMLDAGTGPGETFGLTWGDLDLDRRTVSVTKSLEEISGKLRVKETKNAHRNRTVALSPGTVELLKRHQAAMTGEGRPVGEDDLVFVAPQRGGYLRQSNVTRHHWRPLLKTAGVPSMGLYSLRHTCATLLLMAGVNPKVVSERLGHASVKMTLDVYSHVLPSMQQAAADVMERWLNPNSG